MRTKKIMPYGRDCESCTDVGGCMLAEVMLATECEYCGAAGGESCRTANPHRCTYPEGSRQADYHGRRKHAAHVRMCESGYPCRASCFIARHQPRHDGFPF